MKHKNAWYLTVTTALLSLPREHVVIVSAGVAFSLTTTCRRGAKSPQPPHACVASARFMIQAHRSQQLEDQGDDRTYYAPNRDDRGDDRLPDPTSTPSSFHEYAFFDEAYINVRAGSGGQGARTYKRIVSAGGQLGPPDGGNGGRGGSVLLQVDRSLNTLAGLTTTTTQARTFRADHGGDGQRQYQNGRVGQDCIIRVPPGTMVQEQVVVQENGTMEYIDLGTVNDDVDDDSSRTLIVARGGAGGEGTAVLVGDRSGGGGGGGSRRMGLRRPRRPALGGESRTLKLTLRILADVTVVGVPNAGKSTFLAAATRAKPKIGNYPFTTVVPNLGVWTPAPLQKGFSHLLQDNTDTEEDSEPNSLVLCDVPGLISGAAQGAGLGHAFLRHVERCHVILHLVDATSTDPIADYEMLNEELVRYGTGQLSTKPQVVVVNKLDAYDGASEEWEKGLTTRWSRPILEERLRQVVPHTRIMWISAKEREGVDELMQRLAAFVRKVKGSLSK